MAAAALLLVASLPAAAQNTQARPRITQGIDDNRLTVLRGHVHPLARPQSDQGPANPSLKLERITLMFKPSPEQQADLDALLAQQQDPSSPNFHKWLTPEQFGARFGVAPSDISQVVAWLEAQGFAVVETARSRNWVAFSGTAAQVQSAFHAEIHNYALNGKTYFANAGEPAVPSALAGLVLGFRGLNNFPLKPHSLRSKAASVAVEPNFTTGSPPAHYLAPDDFATIYDLKPLYSRGINGSGQKIAIVGQSNIVLNDIATFRSAAALPASAPNLVIVGPDPGIVDGDVQEASLDIEWAGAVAPNATIFYLFSKASSGGALNALQSAVDSPVAPVISISYGACENHFTAADVSSLTMLANKANTEGITIVASSGDAGAADCDDAPNTASATNGFAVDFPGSIPNVTGVGGSEFNEGNGAFWNATNNANNGSATMYIPEIAWNDTPGSNPPMLLASGGGASKLFAKPVWQAGTGVPNDNARDVPDVSFNGSPNHDGYLICSRVLGSNTTASCQNGFLGSNSRPTVFGGTSFGAPTFAGIVALVNQYWGSSGQGNVNPTLYSVAARTPGAFHDITTGDNKVPCTMGSTDCPNGGTIGFSATAGYDQVTGLGTIDGFNLVSNWSATPVLSASPTSQSINAGASATYQITNNSGIPYALSCSGLPAGASCAAVSVNANSTAQLVISTMARSLAPPSWPAKRQPYSGPRPGTVLAPLALLLLCFTLARTHRKTALVPTGAFVFLFAMLLLGCGSGSTGSGGGPTGTPAGRYTITVVGTSGSTTQSTTVTLQVN